MKRTKKSKNSIKSGSINNYDLIKKIGIGGHGVVWKALRKSDDKILALKIINTELLDEITNEIQQLKEISKPKCHPNLVCYYDSFYDSKHKQVLIEMEYIKGKTCATDRK